MGKMLRAMGVICVVAGCSDDSNPNPTFTLPTASLAAYNSMHYMVAPSLGCGPIVPTTSTHAVTINGSVVDYVNSTKGIAAMVTVYNADDFANPIAMTTSATNGAYSIQIPTAMPDLLYGKVTATGYLDIYYFNLRPDLSQALISKYNVADTTADGLDQLYGLVRVTPDMTKASLAVTAFDCNKNVLQHAIVVISTVSGKRSFLGGASVFYTASGAFPAPELTAVQPETNDNGAAAALNITVSKPIFVQVWGFPDDAAVAMHEKGLALIAEHQVMLTAGQLAGLNAWANQ
jgi:hypothetical protein